MSERTFTIEMIDMDLADLDTDEFLGLTPTYLRSILLELKRCYEREDELLKMAEAVNGNLLALIDALQLIKENLDEVMEYGPFTVEQLKMLRSISNFANDISR